MKAVVALVLISIVSLEAKPFGLGFGRLGWGGMGRQFMNGRGFGGQRFECGHSGHGNQGYETSGVNEFHNIGGHHNKQLSVNEADSSGYHNIGGGSAMNNGGHSGGRYNDYMNGGSEFGRGFDAGSEGMMM